jgi:hypothetical protein
MAGAADIGLTPRLERLIGADLVALVVMAATGRSDMLAELVIETLSGEVALFFGDPFLQPEMRLDDEFWHGFLHSIGAAPAVPEPADFVNALAPL